ncbi:unnamed protein product [Pedinophyceae sp. YPF-701]|nr:unnamed protein product [Pedinophyceae sp. YPF-701]
MSSQFKAARAEAERNEDLNILMSGLRGSNIDQSDFAAAGVEMQLVEVTEDADDKLPLVYDPEQISAYWRRRPVSVIKRILQLLGISGGFLSNLLVDAAQGKVQENEVKRAIEIRGIVTSLGPAYIKLGQALSIRPDILSPAAMRELQKLCDKVPSFPNKIAMATIRQELGADPSELFSELSPDPIAAASLGQVYKGKVRATGEQVAVKVQRPYVLETVTIDLFIIRALGIGLRKWFPEATKRTDVVALLDEWAARFFEELDYVNEGRNAERFAEEMKKDLPQVVVPRTYAELTSRRVLTSQWLEGEKLSQSKEDDVGELVNVGVICYLKQLLQTGNFHADPHPGNLIRTPDGRLAILDFGLMTVVDDNIKYGMIEAIAHLIHRDYDAILDDFVTLQFIPEGTDLRPIKPVLAKVFDQALAGGGAKSINFNDLAADLAQITFDYPFRIPPYFALIIRAIGVLEGIALVGDPDFAIVDEAYPYIARRLLTDRSPRLQESLRYMIYGKNEVFDADRLIDLLQALETFEVSSRTALGDGRDVSGGDAPRAQPAAARQARRAPPQQDAPWPGFPLPPGLGGENGPFGSGGLFPAPMPLPVPVSPFESGPFGQPLDIMGRSAPRPAGQTSAPAPSVPPSSASSTRQALKFVFSDDGSLFREFLMDEVVRSVDAISREEFHNGAKRLGLDNTYVPLLLPGAKPMVRLAPPPSQEDRAQVESVRKVVDFLISGPDGKRAGVAADPLQQLARDPNTVRELLPVLPAVAQEFLPEFQRRLASRVAARFVRDNFDTA